MNYVSIAGLDQGAVAAWIVGLDVGVSAPLVFSRIGDGNSNLTYLVRGSNGSSLILRRPPLGQLLQSAHDVAREHRILSALQGTRVPTPAVLGFTDDPRMTDVPLLLMEHVDGSVVESRESLGSLTEGLRTEISRSMVGALSTIHEVDLVATGLDDLASHKPYALRQLKRWQHQWMESRTRDLPIVDRIHAHLLEVAPEQRETALLHGDFHLRNVIVDVSHGTVAAVLDWELSTLGDPIADLGGLLAYWPEPSESPSPAFPWSGLPGVLTRGDVVEEYARLSGRDVASVGFWFALGMWKVAIILEGVRRRSLDDPRNTPTLGLPPAEAVDGLLNRAWEECVAPSL